MATIPPRAYGFKVGLGMNPDENIALPMTLDFTDPSATAAKDLFQEQSRDEIPFVQSIYIDNSLNGSGMSITIAGTNQKINMAKNMQGYLPVLVPQGPLQFTATSAGNVKVPIIWLSMMVPYLTWGV